MCSRRAPEPGCATRKTTSRASASERGSCQVPEGPVRSGSRMTTSWYAFDARQREKDRKFAEPKPVNRNSNPVPSRSESKRTPMRPFPLPGSRICKTRETTEGSAEPVVRIHSAPGKSQANFPTALAKPEVYGGGEFSAFTWDQNSQTPPASEGVREPAIPAEKFLAKLAL